MPVLFRWKASRRWRILSIIGIAVLLVVQLGSEARGAVTTTATSAGGSFWLFYTAYALIAVLFLGVGSLVWLYGFQRQPLVSALLFVFCSVMTLAFGTLSAPAVGNALLIASGSSCTALAVLFLLLFLLRFPVDILAHLSVPQTGRRVRALHASLAGLGVLCVLAVVRNVSVNFLNVAVPQWLTLLVQLYYVGTSAACMAAVVYSTRHASSVRAQQQTRLFFVGTLLSFVPILMLTVLPALLHLRSAVDGTLSMLFLLFFPLSLGYALLRYQVLIIDSYIRRTVTWIVGGVCLALLAYALFAVGSLLVADRVAIFLACLLGAGVVGAPVLWRVAAILTERYFFPEARYYERLLKQAQYSQVKETFNLQLIAQSLTLDIMTTLKAPEACLFFLDEEARSYTLVTPYQEDERQELLRVLVLDPLASALALSERDGSAAIAIASPLVSELQGARRPLFLNEASHAPQEQHAGLSRYLSPRMPHELGLDLLLAPVYTLQGQLIGILVVGDRGDEQHYAGPELEALQHLARSSAAALETARLYEVTTRQQQRSAREMAQAYEQQRQLSAIKDELIVHMSHELRTPLTEVSGFLDLLGDQEERALDPSLQALFVQKAQHGCADLLSLVDTILNAAQTGALVAPLPCEDVSLTQVVREELDNLGPNALQDHRIQLPGEAQVIAWANTRSVQQIVRNLLSNALKYSPAQATIIVSAAEDGDWALLLVRDEGLGIPPAEKPLLFGKFVRLQRDMSGAIRGTGLGLYICKQLVEAMGGQIWVESSGIEGEGSCFHVRLPSARPRAHAPGDRASDLVVA